jgi:hypothetical protein
MRLGVAAPYSPVTRCARTSQYNRGTRQRLTTWTTEGGTRSQAQTPTGAANAVRLVPRVQTHGEPDENTFHELHEAAVGLKAKNASPRRARRCTQMSRPGG